MSTGAIYRIIYKTQQCQSVHISIVEISQQGIELDNKSDKIICCHKLFYVLINHILNSKDTFWLFSNDLKKWNFFIWYNKKSK